MFDLVLALFAAVRVFFRSRSDVALEILALRQQLAVFKRKQPRPPLRRFDRLFWVLLGRFWSGWRKALIIVQPETVVSWHRAGFRLYWRWKSRRGRPKVATELRQLNLRMAEERRSWNPRRTPQTRL
jgi:putative transposase